MRKTLLLSTVFSFILSPISAGEMVPRPPSSSGGLSISNNGEKREFKKEDFVITQAELNQASQRALADAGVNASAIRNLERVASSIYSFQTVILQNLFKEIDIDNTIDRLNVDAANIMRNLKISRTTLKTALEKFKEHAADIQFKKTSQFYPFAIYLSIALEKGMGPNAHTDENKGTLERVDKAFSSLLEKWEKMPAEDREFHVRNETAYTIIDEALFEDENELEEVWALVQKQEKAFKKQLLDRDFSGLLTEPTPTVAPSPTPRDIPALTWENPSKAATEEKPSTVERRGSFSVWGNPEARRREGYKPSSLNIEDTSTAEVTSQDSTKKDRRKALQNWKNAIAKIKEAEMSDGTRRDRAQIEERDQEENLRLQPQLKRSSSFSFPSLKNNKRASTHRSLDDTDKPRDTSALKPTSEWLKKLESGISARRDEDKRGHESNKLSLTLPNQEGRERAQSQNEPATKKEDMDWKSWALVPYKTSTKPTSNKRKGAPLVESNRKRSTPPSFSSKHISSSEAQKTVDNLAGPLERVLNSYVQLLQIVAKKNPELLTEISPDLRVPTDKS